MKMIRLMGTPAIIDEAGEERAVRGHQTWAVLARVVLSPRPLDRRALAAELFPDAADPLAALRWCLAALRSAFDCRDCLRGDPLEAGLPEDILVDVETLGSRALDIEATGPLLLGIEPRCAPEFDTWLLVERARIAGLVEGRLREEILAALAGGDGARAVRLAERGVRNDPFDERMHVLLVRSLVLAGRADAAVQHVEATEALFLKELGERPSVALRSAARRSVAEPPAGISPATFVSSQIRQGLAALAAGATEAGLDTLRRAAGDAERLGDAYLAAEAMYELGTALVHSVRGFDDEGAVFLRAATERAERCGAGRIASAAFRELGYVEALAGRRPSAATFLASAAALAEEPETRAGIHAVTGFNLVDWGKVSEGIAQHEMALELARETGSVRREIWTLGLGAWGLVLGGRIDEAIAWLERCLTLVEAQRWMAFQPWPAAVLADARLLQGASPASLRPDLEAAFALSCQLADRCWQGATARMLALTFAEEGDFARASDWMADARLRCVRNSDTYVALEVEILGSEVEIARRRNRPDDAERLAREWIARAARCHMDGHVARAAAFIGEISEAAAPASPVSGARRAASR